MYIIFKRSDGYIGQYNTESVKRFHQNVASVKYSFEVLHTAEDWDSDFVTRLEELRAASDYVRPEA